MTTTLRFRESETMMWYKQWSIFRGHRRNTFVIDHDGRPFLFDTEAAAKSHCEDDEHVLLVEVCVRDIPAKKRKKRLTGGK